MEGIINSLGRRKTSVARVYMKPGNGTIVVNKRDYTEFFPVATLQAKVQQAFNLTETSNQYDVTVNVKGGGINGQAEAIRLGIARALIQINEDYKPALKEEGLTTRDPRMVERKKPGQKGARKKFQFSKR